MFEVRLVLRKNVVLNCDGHKKEGNLFINLENIMETVYEYLGKVSVFITFEYRFKKIAIGMKTLY